MKRLLATSAVVAVTTTGCASDQASRYYAQRTYEKKSPSQVAILWKKPSQKFVVIADFQSRGESPEDMRKRAAEIGADAVIVSVLGGPYSRSEEWAGSDRNALVGDFNTRITGTAVKFELGDQE